MSTLNKTVINKYTNKEYTVLEFDNNKVKLQRSDNSTFTIDVKEYHFYYKDKR